MSMFENYFKAVNNPEDRYFTPDEDIMYFIDRYENDEFKIMFSELNTRITITEITAAINQLKTNRSGGPDCLINEMFTVGKNALMNVFYTLFNKIFENAYFPKRWAEGFVIPLHKKGSINNVDNYRGITLLSSLGKLFTRIIDNRLKSWAEKYNVYIEAQSGFRANMSTVDNIFVLNGLITHVLNQGKQLYTLCVDYTKAFDYVVRENLWFKLTSWDLEVIYSTL